MKEKRILEKEEIKGVSLWNDAWKRMKKNKMSVFGGIVIIIFIFIAIFADIIAPYSYQETYSCLAAYVVELYRSLDKLKLLHQLGADQFSI